VPEATSDSDRRVVVACCAIVLVPFVVAAVRMLLIRGGYATASDLSVIEMRIRDIPRHPVLVGPYSRYGWNHPGPAIYYTLALPYWLVGRQAVGLAVGALTINAAACVGTVLVARRRGGALLAAAATVVMLVFVHALGPDKAASAWNPTLPVMPFLAFLALAWSVAVGDAVLLPWMVGVGSFVAQAHVGFDPVVAVVGAGAAVALGVRVRRGDAQLTRRVIGWSVGAAVVAWIGPVADVLLHRGGNVRALFHYFTGAHDRVGASEAWRIVSGELGAHAQWFRGFTRNPFTAEPISVYHATFPIVLVLLIGAAVFAAVRRRRAGVLEALLVATVAVAVATWSISSITGTAYDYLAQWVSAVAVFAVIALAAALGSMLTSSNAKVRGRIVGGVVLVAIAVGALAVRESATFADPSDSGAHLVADAARTLARSPQVRGRVVMVTPLNGLESGLAAAGMLLRLERAGVKIGVPANEAFVYGGHRVAKHPDAAALLGVSIVDHAAEVPASRRGMRLLARLDELTPAQRARYDGFAVALEQLVRDRNYRDIPKLGKVPPGGVILTVWLLEDHSLAPHDSFLGA
jgi:hypothetical protein